MAVIQAASIQTSADLMAVVRTLGFIPEPYAPRTSSFHLDKPICVIDSRRNPALKSGQVLVYVLNGEELHLEIVDWYEQRFVPFEHWQAQVDAVDLSLAIIRAGAQGG